MKKTASVKKWKELEREFRHSIETHGELTALHPPACRFYSTTFPGPAGKNHAARRFKTLACDASFAQTGKRTDDWKRWLDQLVEAGYAGERPVQTWGPESVSRRIFREMEVTGQSTEGFVFDQEPQQYVRPAVGVYCIGRVFRASADYCRELASRAEPGQVKRHPQQRAKPVNGQKLRRLREALNLSQADFSEKCDLSEDTIQRAERHDPVSPKTADRLVQGLVSLGYSRREAEAIRV